ncbi:MAG: phage holin family protein [Lachnospiraceae bacterium]|nr:phage holin family protein [Lachnospiraceae bacterium]
MGLVEKILTLANNVIIQLVIIAVVMDTIFGIIRAVKEHRFNSCFGIDGAIRKISMIVSIVLLGIVDVLIHINLIGFLPGEVKDWMSTNIGISSIGIAEFFGVLYLIYEIVSILKNMTLCGLPVKGVWLKVRKVLQKYTDELPDTDELEGNCTTGSVERHRQKEK